MRTLIAAALLALLALPALGSCDPAFGYLTSSINAPHPSTVAAADFDKDGKTDLVIGSPLDGALNVLRGNGDGSFAASPRRYVVGNTVPIHVADMNGDGWPDLVGGNTANVLVLLNQGDGTFAAPLMTNAQIPFLELAAGDLDGDGRLDVAVAGPQSLRVSFVLYGTGDGRFRNTGNLQFSDLLQSDGDLKDIALSDLDGDGKLDLVAATERTNPSTAFLEVWRNNLPNGFTHTSYTKANARVGELGIAGGKVLLSTTAGVLLYRTDGGALTLQSTIPLTGGDVDMATGDLNGDGTPDVVLPSAFQYETQVIVTNADGTFRRGAVNQGFAGWSAPLLADLNGDGRLDYVALRPDASSYVVLLNSCSALAVEVGSGTSAYPAPFGSPVTFTITVTPAGPFMPRPTGTVSIGAHQATLTAGGSNYAEASIAVADLPVGISDVVIRYSGDASYAPAEGHRLQAVSPTPRRRARR